MQMSKTAAIKEAIKNVFIKHENGAYNVCHATINGGHVVQDFAKTRQEAWYFLRDDRFFSIFTYLGYDIDDVNGLRHFAMTHNGTLMQCVNYALQHYNPET